MFSTTRASSSSFSKMVFRLKEGSTGVCKGFSARLILGFSSFGAEM